MKATVLHGAADLRHETVADPAPDAGEVIVRVEACSICGSDLHGFHGKHPRLVFPRILGHEFSGEVVALGSGVRDIPTGTRVCCDIDIHCGACGPCLDGRTNICDKLRTLGFDRDGGYAQYVAVPAVNLYPLPESVTYDQAAAVQVLGIGYHAVAHRVRPRSGERVAVIGAGPVGLGAALVAKALGAEVTVFEPLSYRLAMARKLGVERALNPLDIDLRGEVLALTGGRGFDKVVECVGGFQEKTVQMAVDLVKRGGQITIVGTFPENRATIPIAYIKDREIDINCSRGNFQAFAPCLELIASGAVNPDRYISHRLPLTQAVDALRLLETRDVEAHKIVLHPQG
ncbi:MAG TPA: alcohol dehydrogenase catalytic domain-containing protein [Burkholderiales bacterium]|jgi:2-desacetyl-2-hydroxyethyl bacteriochlorophyllide A dehydrogenase|nr:alcohol dehydrogenase catalytic domain-containing protein [Burkholderiales bacterium]